MSLHLEHSSRDSLNADGLVQFLDVLPGIVRDRLERTGGLEGLVEVVLDYGRPAEARYRDRVERYPDVMVSEHDIDFVSKSIGEFGSDNRAGIERTLHRISAIRNRHHKIIGLTCRVGRALEGTIDMIDDIVRSGQSILLLGRPGVGKTTKLREVARVLADEAAKRVVIVDTSNEIAGDGDVPHPGIGSARRMQVRIAAEQHNVMIEAVEKK
jgi:stage III sporulation protein SpoIIIAA